MDKAKLLQKRDVERDVELDGVGTVRVRALTRADVMWSRGAKGDDAQECRMLSRALVDPVLTPDECATWSEMAPAGEFVKVMDAVRDLSGMGDGAAKSGVSRVRRRSGH